MKVKFRGGHIYSKYDRTTNEFSGFMRKIKEPIELDVVLLHKWPVGDNMDQAWLMELDGYKYYIHSGVRGNTGESGEPMSGVGIWNKLNAMLPEWLQGYLMYLIALFVLLAWSMSKTKRR